MNVLVSSRKLKMVWGLLLFLGIIFNGLENESGRQIGIVSAEASKENNLPTFYVEIIRRICEEYHNMLNGSTNMTVLATVQYHAWDTNKDGLVTFKEVMEFEESHNNTISRDLALAWHKQYDVNHDGENTIEEHEYARIKADVNEDGYVSMKECMAYDKEKLGAALKSLANSTEL